MKFTQILLVSLPLLWAVILFHFPKPAYPDAYSVFTFINIGMTTSVSLMSLVPLCNAYGYESSTCSNAKTAVMASFATAGYVFHTTELPSYQSLDEFIPYKEEIHAFWNSEINGVQYDAVLVKKLIIEAVEVKITQVKQLPQTIKSLPDVVKQQVENIREKWEL